MFGIPGVGVDRQLLGVPNNVVHGAVKYSVAGVFNFTVPDGVYSIYAQLTGGGGGNGFGGASGCSVYTGLQGGVNSNFFVVSVVPGQVIPVTIGAAGVNGSPSVAGTSGGTTSLGSLASVAGGAGGSTQLSAFALAVVQASTINGTTATTPGNAVLCW
jgi:hypothetical protein